MAEREAIRNRHLGRSVFQRRRDPQIHEIKDCQAKRADWEEGDFCSRMAEEESVPSKTSLR